MAESHVVSALKEKRITEGMARVFSGEAKKRSDNRQRLRNRCFYRLSRLLR